MTAGKRVRGAIYVHRSAVDALSDDDRRRVESIAAVSPDVEWNVVRVAASEISLLLYANVDEDPFPALAASTLVKEDGRRVSQDYSRRSNPPVLHRKEMLVAPSHPSRQAWVEVTARLVAAGAFAEPHRIGTRAAWTCRLAAVGLNADGRPRRDS